MVLSREQLYKLRLESKNERLIVVAGLSFVLMGFALNEWLLTFLFSRDNVLALSTRIVIAAIDLASILFGLLLIRFRKRIKLANLVLLIVSFISFLVFAEIALRFLNRRSIYDLEELKIVIENPNGTGSYRYKPDLDLEYRYIDAGEPIVISIRTNSFGMRSRDVSIENSEQKTRIAFIGDGYVAGSSADTSEHSIVGFFDSLVSDEEYEVLNFGVFAYGPDDMELAIREEVVRFEPDYLFVIFGNANDFRDAYLGVNKYEVPSGILPLWKEYLLRAKIPAELMVDPPYSTWAVRKPPPKPFWHRLEIFKLLKGLKFSLQSMYYEKKEDEGRGITRSFSDFEVSNQFMSFSFWSRTHYPDIAIEAKDDGLEYLRKINEVSDGASMKLFIVSIPFEQQIYSKELNGVDRNGIKYDVSYPQRYVEEFAMNNSIPYLDLLPPMRSYLRENNNSVYPKHLDMHFNEEGRSLIANLLFEFFKENE